MAEAPGKLKISSDSQDKLIRFVSAAASMQQSEGWYLRGRLEDVDRAYLREKDFTDEQRKAALANRKGDAFKLQNMAVPMVMESIENSTGFLTNVYLTDYPMFKFAAKGADQDLALQWNTLVGEDQLHYGWTGEFNQAFRNAEKYNFAPLEVDWCKEVTYKAKSGNGPAGVVLEQLIWEGNRIKAIDPYNTIYDTRVPIHKVHTEGEFVGYVDSMSRIQLKRFLANLGDDRLKNDQKAFESGDWGQVEYYIPHLNPNVILRNNAWASDQFNWTAWVTNEAQNHIKYRNMYTVATLYARLMPYEFGIQAPADQTPDVWKLIAVNGTLVLAKPMVNSHDMLPMIIGCGIVDNLQHQTKSPAENQIPFQDMASALWNAKLNAARRRTVDRMLYNPMLVDPDHINSPNPGAKIPVRPSAYGRKLEEAVHVLPFDDQNSQFFLQEAAGVGEWAMRANGQNRPTMGQFQKGNKLEAEWNQTMANAGNRERSKAIMWENYTMVPVKTILKANYLQFTPSGTRYNREEKTSVTIDPVALRKTVAEFEIGDGLLPSQRMVHGDVVNEALRTMAAAPNIAAGYNETQMFTYLMNLQGANLKDFEKTPEAMQYEQAVQAWRATAMEYSHLIGKPMGENKVFMPEDIQKVVGPMPQPPQPKQAPQPQPGVQPNAAG
jgi:hypothetical protein